MIKNLGLIFFLVIRLDSTAYSQSEGNAQNILLKYILNESNGKYVGLTGNNKDSLWLDPLNYIELVRSFGKQFRIVQGEQGYYATSYSLDSIKTYSDHAIGYVTLNTISHGYILDNLKMVRSKLLKEYLLIKQNKQWYVLSESEDFFISKETYIRWAETALQNRSWNGQENYKNNVSMTLKAFKKVLD